MTRAELIAELEKRKARAVAQAMRARRLGQADDVQFHTGQQAAFLAALNLVRAEDAD